MKMNLSVKQSRFFFFFYREFTVRSASQENKKYSFITSTSLQTNTTWAASGGILPAARERSAAGALEGSETGPT
jgi:hypothetical protein